MVLKRGFARGVVAASAAAAVAFTPGLAFGAERRFELVSPADSLAQIEAIGGFAAPTGDLAVFTSYDSAVGAVPNGPFPTGDSYTAKRTDRGWVTWWSTDLSDSNPGTVGSRTLFTTDDGSRQIFQTENTIDAGDNRAHTNDAVLRESLSGGGRALRWLTPGTRTSLVGRTATATSRDLERILISTEVPLDPADANGVEDLYLLDGDDTTWVARGSTTGSGAIEVGRKAIPGSMADDGSHVYFRTAARLVPEDVVGDDIYRWNREDGSVELLSPSLHPLGPLSWGSTVALGIAGDDLVCFETGNDLLGEDDDWNWEDIYCYRRSTRELQLMSGDGGTNQGYPSYGVAMSADGSSVFFATEIALTGDDTDGTLSLYLRRGGTTTYVARLDSTDLTEHGRAANRTASWRGVRVSEDGSQMIFVTAGAAVAGDTDARSDLYHWSLARGLTLLTAGDDRGEAIVGAQGLDNLTFSENHASGRVVANGFDSVFFMTTDSLAPADADGGYWDVYEWRQNGTYTLISPAGEAPYDAVYMDSTSDGSSVFIVTAEPIVSQDINATRDVYVARDGGGFPSVDPPLPCNGDNCQGPLPDKLPGERPGSSLFVGPGDDEVAVPTEAWHRLLRLRAGDQRSLARRGRTTLRVSVSSAGLVGVRVTARIGKRNVPAATAWKRVARKGTVRIPVQMARRVRAALKQRKRVRLTIDVTHSNSSETVRRTVTLRG